MNNNIINDNEFKNIVNEIENEINNTQIEIFQGANKALLKLYYNVGKIINENFKCGNKFVDELSKELKITYPNIKGFSIRNLNSMKKFYEEYHDNEIVQTASAQIPWSHNILILTRVKDNDERLWYINETLNNGWSYDTLAFQIKSDLYRRQVINEKSNNFNRTLIKPQSELANNMQKDPYILDIVNLRKDFVEKDIENAMIGRIKNTLLELGNGFSFVGNQYKLPIGDEDYYIDLLFYHIKLHCYVVIELKNTKFKAEYVGQVNLYLSAVDDKLKTENDNPTIGIILCREKDKLTVDYSLRDVNKPIGVSSYEISKYLPKNLEEVLPTEEQLNLHIDLDDLESDYNE